MSPGSDEFFDFFECKVRLDPETLEAYEGLTEREKEYVHSRMEAALAQAIGEALIAGRLAAATTLNGLDAFRPVPVRLSPPGEIMHILRFGLALCEFTLAAPKNWPPGHTWVRVDDIERTAGATICRECKRRSRDLGLGGILGGIAGGTKI
jgi:hypothetical protein